MIEWSNPFPDLTASAIGYFVLLVVIAVALGVAHFAIKEGFEE